MPSVLKRTASSAGSFNPRASLLSLSARDLLSTQVPGVEDKRLNIREGELASVFQLANKAESRADVVLRDGWDSKPLKNVVKGATQDGISNSAGCQEPHISISGDTTRSELIRRMPDGADENGFGNRFIYCYVFRTKLCPLGGPLTEWGEEILHLQKAVEFAKKQGCVGLTPSAKTTCVRLYMQTETNKLPGLAGKMTSRAAAHIRRLALIYAMLDMSSAVDTKHIRAAKLLWDYCEDSARYIFNGTTKGQIKFLQWFDKQTKPVTASFARDAFFHRNTKIERVKPFMDDLIRLELLEETNGVYHSLKTKKAND